jgi:hypothetical protein
MTADCLVNLKAMTIHSLEVADHWLRERNAQCAVMRRHTTRGC